MAENTSQAKKWKSIAVPQEVIDLLNRIKSRSGQDTANWKILVEALSFYEEFREKPKMVNEFSMIEKVSWYITKLSLAYGTFAVNPSEDTAPQLIERLQEIEMKMQVDTGALQKLVNQYVKIKDDNERRKFRIQMNQAFKLLIKEMIMKAVGGEENDSA